MYEPPIGFAAVAKSNYEHGFRIGYDKGRYFGLFAGATVATVSLALGYLVAAL